MHVVSSCVIGHTDIRQDMRTLIHGFIGWAIKVVRDTIDINEE